MPRVLVGFGCTSVSNIAKVKYFSKMVARIRYVQPKVSG